MKAKLDYNELIARVEKSNGKIFSVTHKRVAPKCAECEKSNKKWVDEIVCPRCGGELKKTCTYTGRLGVRNPKHTTAPGTGQRVGVGYQESKEQGLFKYFAMNAKTRDGNQGDYRSCRIDSITAMKMNGVEYELA